MRGVSAASDSLPLVVWLEEGREDFSLRQLGRLATNKADLGGASRGLRSSSGFSEESRDLKSTLGASTVARDLAVLVDGLRPEICIRDGKLRIGRPGNCKITEN